MELILFLVYEMIRWRAGFEYRVVLQSVQKPANINKKHKLSLSLIHLIEPHQPNDYTGMFNDLFSHLHLLSSYSDTALW